MLVYSILPNHELTWIGAISLVVCVSFRSVLADHIKLVLGSFNGQRNYTYDEYTNNTCMTLDVFVGVTQVTVKFGENILVLNKISLEIMGKELKSLIRTRLGSLMPQYTRFQVRSQINGRLLRDNESLGEVFRGLLLIQNILQ